MALWDDRIGASPAWAAVESARSRVAELTEAHAGHEAITRPSHLLEILSVRLRALDPDLATDGLLAELNAKVGSLMAVVEAHLQTPVGQPGSDLAAVNTAADQVAQLFGSIPPGGNEELVAISDGFRHQLDGLHRNVREVVEEVKASLTESTDQHTATLEERKAEAAQLAARLTEVDSQIAELKASIETLISEWSAAATTAANEAKAGHDAQLDAGRIELDTLLESAKDSFQAEEERQLAAHEEMLNEQSTTAGRLVSEIEELKSKAEKLVGAVGRTGLSGGFQQWEKTEREQADRMRLAAIVFGLLAAVAAVGLLVLKANVANNNGTDLVLAIGALVVPASLGGVAAYAGKESSRHRRNQIIARRTEIELASFAPYLAELSAEQQAELTAIFAPVFFGQATSHMASDGKSGDDQGPLPLTTDVLGRVGEAIKAWTTKPPAE